ncbi:methyl-accepting chemotaxis protein, partial [Cronobacter sakazakii]
NTQAQSATDAASRGGEVVSKAISTMQLIESASAKIGDITSVIDGIAFQTNI